MKSILHSVSEVVMPVTTYAYRHLGSLKLRDALLKRILQ